METLSIGGRIISLRFRIVDALVYAEIEVTKAVESLEKMQPKIVDFGLALEPFAKAIDAIMGAVDDAVTVSVCSCRGFISLHMILQVSPVATLAWNAVSALYKVCSGLFTNFCDSEPTLCKQLLSEQMKTDRELVDMVDKMRRAFDFSVEVNNLGQHANSLKPLIKEMLDETVKCSRFVQKCASKSFVGTSCFIFRLIKMKDK